MKIIRVVLITACTILGLTGCSSDYVISTNDGHMMTAHGKPHKDKDTGLVAYKDNDGTIHQVHQSDIKEIVEKQYSDIKAVRKFTAFYTILANSIPQNIDNRALVGGVHTQCLGQRQPSPL